MLDEPIVIEPMRSELANSFRACLDSVCRERFYLGSLQAPALELVEKFVARGVERGESQYAALLKSDHKDTVVGWCDAFTVEGDTFRHRAKLGMGVAREHRGKGLGRRLLQATLGHAFGSGKERVDLTVYATNRAAIRLYESVGFVHEGVQRRARKLDDVYDDIIIMGLLKNEWRSRN